MIISNVSEKSNNLKFNSSNNIKTSCRENLYQLNISVQSEEMILAVVFSTAKKSGKKNGISTHYFRVTKRCSDQPTEL